MMWMSSDKTHSGIGEQMLDCSEGRVGGWVGPPEALDGSGRRVRTEWTERGTNGVRGVRTRSPRSPGP